MQLPQITMYDYFTMLSRHITSEIMRINQDLTKFDTEKGMWQAATLQHGYPPFSTIWYASFPLSIVLLVHCPLMFFVHTNISCGWLIH